MTIELALIPGCMLGVELVSQESELKKVHFVVVDLFIVRLLIIIGE